MFVIEITALGRNGWVREEGKDFVMVRSLDEATVYPTDLEAECARLYIPTHNDPTIVALQPTTKCF